MPQAVRASLVAAFDFSREIPSTRAIDIGPFGLHGEVVTLPARAMEGWNWTGEEQCWRRKPEHYGAFYFHDDDLYDAGWALPMSTVQYDVGRLHRLADRGHARAVAATGAAGR
jgi:N,N-dimethylformamidase